MGGKDRLASAAGSILESFETLVVEPVCPLADMLFGDADPPGNFDQRQSTGHTENDPSTANEPGRERGATHLTLKFDSFFRGQFDPQSGLSASHGSLRAVESRCITNEIIQEAGISAIPIPNSWDGY